MSEQLTKGERLVLQELVKSNERVTSGDLALRLDEKDERIVSILNSLSQRELIELSIQEVESYSLTAEGSEYAEAGLPEVLLFRSVQDLGGQAELGAAITKSGISPQARGIAINWARKNGWLRITKEEGTTHLEVIEDLDAPLETLLSLINAGSDVPENIEPTIKQAIERTLVDTITTKVFEAGIMQSKEITIQAMLSEEVGGVVTLTPEMLSSGSWKGESFRPFNMELEPAYTNYGKKHPYAEFNDWLREILVGMGFTEWFGPYVETEFWNNDTLFVPQDHVAREVQDQFKVVKPFDHGAIPDTKYYKAVKAAHEDGGDTGSKGWEAPFSKEVSSRLCLRSHTTPVSMRYLWEHRESPQKMFIVDRNFRSESLSASHAQEFNQCEGIIMDKGLTLRDLLGYLTEICKRVGIKKVKYKPGQFPFTEPSVEVFAKHDVLGWIEVAPGGIFRPEVTYPLGIRDSVLAWGIGSGRMYMASMGINDIRELFSRDLNWIRRSYFVR